MENFPWKLEFTSGKNDRGFLEISLVVLLALSFVLSAILGGWMYSHNQFLQTHIAKIKEEYEVEGVFWEMVNLLEERGPGFMDDKLFSSFLPTYEATITRDTIAIRKDEILLLEARFRWEGLTVRLVWVENLFVRPYAR